MLNGNANVSCSEEEGGGGGEEQEGERRVEERGKGKRKKEKEKRVRPRFSVICGEVCICGWVAVMSLAPQCLTLMNTMGNVAHGMTRTVSYID